MHANDSYEDLLCSAVRAGPYGTCLTSLIAVHVYDKQESPSGTAAVEKKVPVRMRLVPMGMSICAYILSSTCIRILSSYTYTGT